MWSITALTNTGLMAFTILYAALMGRPASPLESTSSSMTRSQSAITWGRVPGRVRISLSVLMGAHSSTPDGTPRPPRFVVRMADGGDQAAGRGAGCPDGD